VVIVNAGVGHDVDEQRSKPDAPQSQGCQESAIEAVTLPIEHYIKRRPVTLFANIGQAVQIFLDGKRRFETEKFFAQVCREAGLKFSDERHGALSTGDYFLTFSDLSSGI
jgi:hypothetical protein